MRMAPNVAPDFDPVNTKLMYAAIISIGIGLLSYIVKIIMTIANKNIWRGTIYFGIALLFSIFAYIKIFTPTKMSAFYQGSYCSYTQKYLYKDIISYIQSHDGKLPNRLDEVSTDPSRLKWCYMRSTLFPLPPVYRSFTLNSFVAGKKLADIPDADHVVLLSNCKLSTDSGIPDNISIDNNELFYVILFCDGRSSQYFKIQKDIILNPYQLTIKSNMKIDNH
jgi:hypothetical protein